MRLDYSRFGPVHHRWDSLAALGAAPDLTDGVHTVGRGEGRLDLISINGGLAARDRGVLVVFTGAVANRARLTGPFFSGVGVARQTGLPAVGVGENAVADLPELGLGWYRGVRNAGFVEHVESHRTGAPMTTMTRPTAPVDPIGADPTRTLRALKLGGMADTLPERLHLARQQQLGHAAFLELVLSDEVTRREGRSAALRAAKAGLDPTMRLDTFDDQPDLTYDRHLWSDLTTLRFADAGTGVLILGPVGVGKTIWPPRSATSPSDAASPSGSTAPTNCSPGSAPRDSTTPSTPSSDA